MFPSKRTVQTSQDSQPSLMKYGCEINHVRYDYILVLQPETQIFKLIETALHCQCFHTIQASSFICLIVLSLFLYVISSAVVFTLVAFACSKLKAPHSRSKENVQCRSELTRESRGVVWADSGAAQGRRN
jgi:hypothetical protein